MGSVPLLFQSMIKKWPATKWTPEYLKGVFCGKMLTFRIGKRNHSGKILIIETTVLTEIVLVSEIGVGGEVDDI